MNKKAIGVIVFLCVLSILMIACVTGCDSNVTNEPVETTTVKPIDETSTKTEEGEANGVSKTLIFSDDDLTTTTAEKTVAITEKNTDKTTEKATVKKTTKKKTTKRTTLRATSKGETTRTLGSAGGSNTMYTDPDGSIWSPIY